MTDIVERIRQMVRDRLEGFHDPGICAELTGAADEIERLRAVAGAQEPTLPELPSPNCTYADHSYPAYSSHQMVDYGRACAALATSRPAAAQGEDA